MKLKPLIWNGNYFKLSIQRHWEVFFGLAAVCEINRGEMSKRLPIGAAYHISGIYQMIQTARSYFPEFDSWWNFSCSTCDQYCDYFVLQRPRDGNTFSDFHSAYLNEYAAIQNLAKASKGYAGPESWDIVKMSR